MEVAHPQSGSSSLPDSWSNWNLEMLVFEERGKPEYPEKNLSEQGRKPTTKLNPRMASTPGFETEPHRWEASALTTAPSLAPLAPKITCITLFLYISLPSLADHDAKLPNFTVCGGGKHKTTIS